MNDTFDLASIPGFDQLPGAMIAYDAGGRVIRANRAALDILGFASEQEIVGTSAAQAGWFRTDPAGWPEVETRHPALVAIRGGKPERGVVARLATPARPEGGDPALRGSPNWQRAGTSNAGTRILHVHHI